jgi:hypothetical protein
LKGEKEMTTDEKVVATEKVPRKEKVLYFLRFHAWSMIAIGIAWFVYFAVVANGLSYDPAKGTDFSGFLFSLGIFALFPCVAWGVLALKVAQVDEDNWEEGSAHFSWGIFWMKALCMIGAGCFAILFGFRIRTMMESAQYTACPDKHLCPLFFLGSWMWYFIGACSFWSAIGRILNKLERRK